MLGFKDHVYSLCPLPGHRLLIAGRPKQAEVWDVQSKECVWKSPDHGKQCWSAATEGERIAIGEGGYEGGDVSVRLFGPGLRPDGSHGGHHNAIPAVAFHSGRLASGDMDGQVFLDGRKVGTPLKGHVTDLVWSADGRHLAASTGVGTVEWREAEGKRVTGWKFPGTVKSLALTPDNKHLLTGNADGTIFVLKLP
jgi:WD40 repeat protein